MTDSDGDVMWNPDTSNYPPPLYAGNHTPALVM